MLSVIGAGVLMLPPVLVMLGTAPVVALLSLPGLALLCYQRRKNNNNNKPEIVCQRKRAIVTGGSSGIGLAVAQQCVQQGFDEVFLMARNVEKLNQAKELLLKQQQSSQKVRIEALSVDVSSEAELKVAADKIFGKKKDDGDNDEEAKTFTCLFCVAGITYPDYFDNLPATTFAKLVQTNQLGTIHTVQAFSPRMVSGTIMLTSSMAGQVGTFGYTAYSPTKFALRGFAEALHMELVARPVSVFVAYPPDTETPGFEQENLTKPKETQLISEDGGLAKPEFVAKLMVQEACKRNPNFSLSFSFDGWMLSALTCGFGPVTSLGDAVSQVAGMGFFRVVSLFYLKAWHNLIRQHAKDKQMTKSEVEEKKDSRKDETAKEEDATTKSSDK